jgi:hypothetical protein
VLASGGVQCWGDNSRGQLGNGPTNIQISHPISSIPVIVSNIVGATSVAVALHHACAVLSDGTVRCWGDNSSGQLGVGTTVSSSLPVTVGNLSGAATAIAASSESTCALLSGGTAQCWGRSDAGQLGDGSATGPNTCSGLPCSTTPVAVSDLSGATTIVAGTEHFCALLSTSSIDCWGLNYNGQLGNGSTTNSTVPIAVAPAAVGAGGTCVAPHGQSCTVGAQCQSGICYSGVCAGDVGDSCTTNADCTSGDCRGTCVSCGSFNSYDTCCPSGSGVRVMGPNEYLSEEQIWRIGGSFPYTQYGPSLNSCNGVYQLIMQNDGNLVVYQNGGAIWATATNLQGYDADYAIMQDDGNFVIYKSFGAIWATGTQGNPGAVLALDNVGNVIVYAPSGAVLWQSGS